MVDARAGAALGNELLAAPLFGGKLLATSKAENHLRLSRAAALLYQLSLVKEKVHDGGARRVGGSGRVRRRVREPAQPPAAGQFVVFGGGEFAAAVVALNAAQRCTAIDQHRAPQQVAGGGEVALLEQPSGGVVAAFRDHLVSLQLALHAAVAIHAAAPLRDHGAGAQQAAARRQPGRLRFAGSVHGQRVLRVRSRIAVQTGEPGAVRVGAVVLHGGSRRSAGQQQRGAGGESGASAGCHGPPTRRGSL